MKNDNFKSSGFSWRLVCGNDVIENNLAELVIRAGAKRAFVLCSPSINRKTDTVKRIATALEDRFAGVFDGLEKDSTYSSVQAAKAAATKAGADLLIAVGGGSVMVATRAVAIFMAETSDPFKIMTQYPPGGQPFSPKLLANKLPIINIPTTPTSAMNRAGTGLKNPELTHRMEYFDPKTRPQAIVLDDRVLMTTPFNVLLSTATTVFQGAVGSISDMDSNPLVAGDQAQAFKLAFNAYSKLLAEPNQPSLRRDLCLAAFLQNRAEDDGRGLGARAGSFSGDYAVATALHLKYPNIGQGEASSVLQSHVIRLADELDPASTRKVAEALGVWTDGLDTRSAGSAIAEKLDAVYQTMGLPKRLRDLGVPQEDFPALASETVNNFNARNSAKSGEERIAKSMRLLNAAW